MNSCTSCNLCNCAYQQVRISGNCAPEECELLILGDYPKQEDDLSGYPLSGSTYTFLWDLLYQVGVKFQVGYLVNCIPIDLGTRRYRKPEPLEYSECMNTNLFPAIQSMRPKCILTLGNAPLEMMLKGRVEDPKIADYRERSHKIKIGDYEVPMLATYHPDYVMRLQRDSESNAEVMYNRFIDDIVYACRHAMAHRSEGKFRSVIVDANQFEKIVDIWMNDDSVEYIGYDTESNGLDPLVPGSKITSFSVSADALTGFNVFLYHPDIEISDSSRERILTSLRRLLLGKKIVVHHAKHEYRFAKVLLGITPNITDDTMYMSYILFLAQRGISHGLKYLSGRFIALPPWEEKLHAYTSLFSSIARVKNYSDERADQWINEYSDWISVDRSDIQRFWNIIKDPNYYIKHEEVETEKDPLYWLVPVREMVSYAGMDAIAPLLLMQKFKPQIDADEGLSEAYKRMMRCADAFANIELHGCKFIDPDRWSERYLNIMNGHLEEIRKYPEVIAYEQETGTEFSATSPKCLQDILYKRMKYPVLVTTSTGNASAGDPAFIALIKQMREQLEEDDPRLQFLWHLRDYKKLRKIQNDYFKGLKKLIRPRAYDGVHDRWIDPIPDHSGDGTDDIFFSQYLLHGTDSGRASSNYHTIPHRSDVSKAISSIYYEHGGVLFQADHSQLELRVLACLVEKYYDDPALADAYREGKDIHRFNACFTGDTKVMLTDGSIKTFEELVDLYGGTEDTFEVLSADSEDNIVVGIAHDPRETKVTEDLVEVELDNGDIFKCTPDHLWKTTRGYIQAQYLKEDDEIISTEKGDI